MSAACSSTHPPRTKYQQGCARSMADAAKRQYFAQRNLYKYEFDQQQHSASTPRRYSFVIPPDPNAPEKKVPYTITIPVE